MSVTAPQLVGREEELQAIFRVLEAPELLPSVAVLWGEAGIGKTSLWLAGLDAAAAGGYRVMSSRPSEVETQFSFAGLTDLLGNVAEDVLPELPPVQRRALESALLIGESELHAEERTVAAAFLGALRLLSADGPLVAVDDVQWLDAASLAALRYALHRLDREPVAALLAVRGDPPAWLRQAVSEERLRVVGVGGLSVGATHEMLRTHLDAAFPRPTLIRIWETAQGNPFFALELATALQRRGGTLAPGEELPIPSDLDELLRVRVASLRAPALAVARAVAALADPTVTIVEAAIGARFERGLAQALDARILEVDGLRVRFTHPLLGAAVAARQTPARRRALNSRLADIVPSAEERARHLALATAEPDGDVASVLDDAARAAHARGAPVAAAELAEQALRLTPASRPDEAHRRLLVAAEMHDVAGDIDRATALLEQARAGGSARQSAGGHSRKAGSDPGQPAGSRGSLPRGTLGSRGRRCAPGDHPPQSRPADGNQRWPRARDRAQRVGRPGRRACERPRAPLSRSRSTRPDAVQRRARDPDVRRCRRRSRSSGLSRSGRSS